VIRLLAEHRVAANLAMIMMTLAGLWAIKSIPSSLDPPMALPLIFVEVEWRGASAEDIEELVTTPIEQQLRTLNSLRELTSRTNNGAVQIRVMFDYDADMVVALDQVKQRVANIRNLPLDIEPPTVRRWIDMEPIAAVLVTGPDDINELIPLVRTLEKDLLGRGIEGVLYDGLPEEEIALLIGGQRLHELGLTMDELAAEVARVSRNVPAGTVGRGQGSRQLRSLDQERDPLSFERLLIRNGDQLIRLGNIAEVVQRPRDGQPIVTQNGRPAIEMMLWRSTYADAWQAEQVLKTWLDEVRPTLPEGVELTLYNNVWDLLGEQLGMIMKNGATGLVLVVLTLFAFLSARVGWWIMVGIPVSFMLALALFYSVFGYGVSIIALIGFIMALGIVVDDAIVVGEDAVTQFESGKSPVDAAVAGAERMWVPVVTSSMTTMAAFLPLILIGGRMGASVLALPTVLLCVILASLIECFAVLPGHLKSAFERQRVHSVSTFRRRFDAAFGRLRRERFEPLVKRALDYPGATVSAALGAMICAFSLVASQHVGIAFIMGFDIQSLSANVEFSASASDAQKQHFIDELEAGLDRVNRQYDDVNVQSWTTRYNLAEFNKEQETGVQYASIDARYAFEEARTLAPAEFVEQWRANVNQPPYVEQLLLAVEGGENNGQSDIALALRGTSSEQLRLGADRLKAELAGYPGVSNVTDDLPYGKEQLIYRLTPTGRTLGLTSESLGSQLRSAYNGRRVQIFNQNNSELEVRVMLPDAERDNLASLQQFPIRTPDGTFVPLANVATLHNRRGIDVIRHQDSEMAIRIYADVDEEANNAISIVADLEENRLAPILEQYDLSFGLSGKSRQDQVMLEVMGVGAVLTLILIYLILAWVFASYLWPLAIMTAIPFGLTGAIAGHWLLGMDIGAMSLLAFFSLTGIVVNDSIVLISFVRRSVESGTPIKQALFEAVSARFRAVILTSLTTIAGLLPLIFETSTMAMYITPIATTICFGLAFATLLVLLVIPALVLLLEHLKVNLGDMAARQIARVRPSQGANA
jgi:multidrug efflux pump subunit AcrB